MNLPATLLQLMYEMRTSPTVENILAFYDLCVDCDLEELGQKYLSTLVLSVAWTREAVKDPHGWFGSPHYRSFNSLCLSYYPPKDDRVPYGCNLWHTLDDATKAKFSLDVYVLWQGHYELAKSTHLNLLEFIKLITASAETLPSLLEPYRADKPLVIADKPAIVS